MPDVHSHVIGIANVETDEITDIVAFTTPVSFRISKRFAGRLASLEGSTEVIADTHHLRRELAALLQKTKARAA